MFPTDERPSSLRIVRNHFELLRNSFFHRLRVAHQPELVAFTVAITLSSGLLSGALLASEVKKVSAEDATTIERVDSKQAEFTKHSEPELKIEKPAIVSREEWGSKAHPIGDDRRQVPAWITVHHAGEVWKAEDDPVMFVRRMQEWGQNRPKLEKPPRDTYWPDLPYHFLIAPDGRIFEGRPIEYEPESNTKYPLNGNIGVEMMGDFNVQRPTPAQLDSCVKIIAWLSTQYNIDMEHIRTHRDAAPGQTDCPGKDFYRYLEDGQFKSWVKKVLSGENPNIEQGPPLEGGPDK